MGEHLEAVDFVYVASDIPAGMSIREWRASRAVRRAAERQAKRDRGRRQWRAALMPLTLTRAVGRSRAWRRRTASGPIDRGVTA
jgi:hypothetical protein